MKVLIDIDCKRVGEGIASSLFWIPEMEIIMWISNTKPTMDMFDETQPDFVIADSAKFATPEMKIASSRYPHTKMISIGRPMEPNSEVKHAITEPHLSISDHSLQRVPSIPFEGGAMIGDIGCPPFDKDLQTDLLCITDYISDEDNANEALSFLCENYNIKIFGKKKVSFPHYLGQIDKNVQAQAIAPTLAYVDLDGSSWYDAAWLGKECVSISKGCFRSFSNIEELKSAVDEAIEEGEKSSEKIKLLIKNKTYFELVSDILLFFNLIEQRNILMEKKRELTC